MSDIVPELQEQILTTFEQRESIDIITKAFWRKIEDETANLIDAFEYTKRISEIASETLERCITEDVLPEGKMYWNIAERTVVPLLKSVHKKTNSAASGAQKLVDRKNKVGLNSMPGDWPEKRIKALVQRMADMSEDTAYEYAKLKALFGDPIKNISQSFLDDFVEKNVEFRQRSGMKTLIVRQETARCCKWCRNLAGVYDYSDVPKDVFRRHDSCRCMVLYKYDKTAAYEDVWTKKDFQTYRDARIARIKELENKQKA